MAAKYDDPEVDSSEDSQLRIVIELAVYSDYQWVWQLILIYVTIIIAVKHLDSTAIQVGDSAVIWLGIQQPETSLELPIFLNHWMASRVAPTS